MVFISDETIKKLWACFVLLNLVAGQSLVFFPARAADYAPTNLPILTRTYRPSQSVVIAPSSTPLAWSGVERAYERDLPETSVASVFTADNSAVLKVIPATQQAGAPPADNVPPSTEAAPAAPTAFSPGVVTQQPASPPESVATSTTEALPATSTEPLSSPGGLTESLTPATETPITLSEPTSSASSQPASAPANPAPTSVTNPAASSSEIRTYADEVKMTNFLQSGVVLNLGPDTFSPSANNVLAPTINLGGSSRELSAPAHQSAEPAAAQEVVPAPADLVPAEAPSPKQPASASDISVGIVPVAEVSTSTPAASSTPEAAFVPLLDFLKEALTDASTTAAVTDLLSSAISTTASSTEIPAPTSTEASPALARLASSTLVSAPALEYSGFVLSEDSPNLATGTKPTQLSVKFSLASLPVPSSQLFVEYAVGTSSWQSLDVLDLSQGASNITHNGYFSVVLPLALYSHLSSLQFRLTYQAKATSLVADVNQTVLALDGVWLNASFPSDSQDDEDLAAMSLPPLTPEQFAHLEFFGPLMELFMPSDLATNPITVGSKQKHASIIPLRLLPLGVSTSTPPTRAGETVTYLNAFSSTDLEYKLTDTGLKENIILKDNTHPAKFRYLVNFDGYEPVQTTPSTIVLYQKHHKEDNLYKLYTLSAPIMTDAQGHSSDQLVFRLKGNLLTLTPDAAFLKYAAYPVVIDPTISITVLNVHSHPIVGENWNMDFTTAGTADLTITPADQATVDDMQFQSLMCGNKDRAAQVQQQDQGVLFYPQWSCADIATVSFLDLKTGDHHMVFNFGGQTADAFNSTITWSGAGGNTNWSNAANWVGGVAPGSSDLAVFDGTCGATCNATINVSTNTGGISLAAGFTGTITQATDTVFTVGGSNFTIASGTMVSSASTTSTSLVINGSFTQTGGTFTAPKGNMGTIYNVTLSGGTFNHNGGTVTLNDIGGGVPTTLTCSGSPFAKVIINKSTYGTLTISSGCVVPLGANPTSTINRAFTNNGTIIVDSGTWTVNGGDAWQVDLTNNGTITHNGNGWVSGGGFVNGSSGVVTYAGTTASFVRDLNIATGTFPSGLTITLNDFGGGVPTTLTCSGSPFAKVIFNKTNTGSLPIASGCTVPLGDNPTSATGIFTNNGTIIINSGTWTETGNVWYLYLTNNGTITHNGNGWVSGGGFVNGSSGVVTYAGTTASFVYDLNIATGTFPSGLTVTLNDIGGGVPTTLTCSGSPFAKVILNKSNTGSMTISSGCVVPLGDNPTSATGVFTNNGTIVINSGTWTETGDVWYLYLINNGTITHNGNGWVSGGGFVNGSSGIVTYAGTTASFVYDLNIATGTFPSGLTVTLNDIGGGVPTTLACSSLPFANLTINKSNGGSFTLNSSCALTGNLIVSAGTVANPATAKTITIQGNFSQTSAGTFGGSNLTLSFEGSGASTLSKTAGTFASPIQINNTGGGTTKLMTALTTTGGGATCDVTTGTFDLNGNNFSCGSTFTVANGTTLTLDGNETTVTTPTLASGSTVLYKGNGNSTADTLSQFRNWSYSNLTINTTDSGDTIDGSALSSLTIPNNLSLTSGNFKTPTTVTITGNVSGASGAITSGTVVLNGTNQQITGTPTFYNLTKNVASADTLTFGPNSLTTINGSLNLQGGASNLLSLRSSSPNTQWQINPVGTRTIAYLDVQDSNNINPGPIVTKTFNITNSGNNTNWAFYYLAQTDYQVFVNQNNVLPGSALGTLTATTTITTTSSPIRLRINLQVTNDNLATSSASFKLQVATSTSASWFDIGTMAGSGWWNGSWQNRRKITFNNASSTSDLTNFPVLVSLNATSTGNIDYTKTKAAGADVRFVASDNTTALNYEIEKWDTSATSTVWVKVPTIHASSTTDFMWMYYNNPSATDNATTTGVWDGSFKNVLHLPDGVSLTTNDSSSNVANATNHTATAGPGKIGGAATFGSTSKYISLGNLNNYAATDFTVSTWVNFSSLSAYNSIVVGTGETANALFISAQANGQGLRAGRTAVVEEANASYTFSTGIWYNVALSRTGGGFKFYVNGVGLTTAGSSSYVYVSSSGSTSIGADVGFHAFNGTLDELRVASTSRSSDYILAEYKTDSGTFNSYAAEESISPSAVWNFYDNPSVSSSATISSLLLPSSNIQGTYQEGNPTALNPNAVAIGQSIEYDFALSPQNLVSGTDYYFRMVRNDGTVIDTYTNYPSLLYMAETAPNAPTSLGPSSVTSGGYITTSTPQFTFTLTDPDGGDTVKYQIQISTSSAFTTNVIDYTSALAAQGAASFTVGQAAGAGSYTTGSSATTLANNSIGYYWRVFAIDNSGAFSASTTANSGAVAFKVDTVTPTPGSLSATSTSPSNITVSISGASDDVSGLSATPYIYRNVTNSTSTQATSSASVTFTGLSVNTQYSFVTQVTDAAGNTASTAPSSIYTLANAPTSLATTSVSTTTIALTWSANSNPAATTFVLQNVTLGTSATTTATSSAFSTLACGTSYTFRVKALNGDAFPSAYSSSLAQSTSACNQNPNAPTSLGPSSVTSGGYITTSTPSFSFTLTDPDGSDTVKYQIQISTSSGFSTFVIDYTSALAAQGSASFTVGQAAGSGSYAVGSSATTLANSSSGYYWRVKAIDNSDVASSFSIANSGAVAFKVDTVAPTPGSLSVATTSATSLTATISGASDATSGLSANPYTFFNLTNSTDSGATSSTSWLSSSLTPNTQYTFYARVSDVAGNTATNSNGSRYTLANISTSLTATATSQTQVSVSWNANSNPNGTEYYAFNSTASTTSGWITATSTSFSGLSCGTTYSFNVKARNGDGTETATTTSVSQATASCNNTPDVPISLGPSSVTNGGWINTSTPAFTFNLSDPDVSDTVSFIIQLSTTSNFSNLAIDATSVLQSQGSTTYTAASLLADSANYYWRVAAADNHSATSSFATANSGAIAFKIDTVAPVAGTLSLGSITSSSITASISGASDALSGLATAPYLFSNSTAGTNSAATTSASWLSQSLSANVRYTVFVQTTDLATNTTTTGVSAYTLANIPTTVAATADSQTQITVSWNANNNSVGTEYYATNLTASTTSGWITSTSSVFSGLTCNTPYSFNVKARNGDGMETATTSLVSQTTSVCSVPPPPPSGGGGGGGGSPLTPPPGGFKALINNDAVSTATTSVTLTMVGGAEAKSMAIANDPVFTRAVVEPYVSSRAWDLCTPSAACPDGTYTVYVKFYSASRLASAVVSDSILLDTSPTPPPPEPFTVSLLAGSAKKHWSTQLSNVSTSQLVSLRANLSLPESEKWFTYQFDCNNDGVFEKTVDQSQKTTYTARNLCSYPKPGLYTAKVMVTFAGYTTLDTVTIVVGTLAPPQLPPPTHAACQNSACTVVSGVGTDQCRTNTDCQQPLLPPFHSVCENNACVAVAGGGADQCILNTDCQVPVPPATHLACQYSACVSVVGAGANQCATDLECTPAIVPPPTTTPPAEPFQTPTTTPPFFQPPEIGPIAAAVASFVASGLSAVTQGMEDIVSAIGATARMAPETARRLVKTVKNNQVQAQIAAGTSAIAIAPTALVLQYSLASNGLFVTATSLADLYASLLGLLHSLLTNLGLRKRRKYWGTVYDSIAKQPLDPAIVELVDSKSGMVVDTSITDMAGRFGFLIKPGTYFIRARKTHYTFPSTLITGEVDGIFTNLYHGGQLTIYIQTDVLSPNIPMDPNAFDWNQLDKQRIIKFHPRLELALQFFLQVLFWGGAAFALTVLIVHPTVLNLAFVAVYLLLAALRRLIPNQRLWGTVASGREPVAGLILELCPLQIPTMVIGRAMTNEQGKYFLKAPAGKYLLRIEKKNGEQNAALRTVEVVVSKDGVVNDLIDIDD